MAAHEPAPRQHHVDPRLPERASVAAHVGREWTHSSLGPLICLTLHQSCCSTKLLPCWVGAFHLQTLSIIHCWTVGFVYDYTCFLRSGRCKFRVGHGSASTSTTPASFGFESSPTDRWICTASATRDIFQDASWPTSVLLGEFQLALRYSICQSYGENDFLQ